MYNQQTVNERELLSRLKNGDQEAFRAVFNRYSRQLYHVAFQYLRSKSDCEEIVQEVFFKIWLHRAKIKENLPLVPYLTSIARNLIFNKSRRKIVEDAYMQYIMGNPKAHYASPEAGVQFNEIKHLTDGFVENLPQVRQEVFRLSRVSNLSNKEIALQLNVTERTVENHIYRALKSLKVFLKKRGYSYLLAISAFFI